MEDDVRCTIMEVMSDSNIFLVSTNAVGPVANHKVLSQFYHNSQVNHVSRTYQIVIVQVEHDFSRLGSSTARDASADQIGEIIAKELDAIVPHWLAIQNRT